MNSSSEATTLRNQWFRAARDLSSDLKSAGGFGACIGSSLNGRGWSDLDYLVVSPTLPAFASTLINVARSLRDFSADGWIAVATESAQVPLLKYILPCRAVVHVSLFPTSTSLLNSPLRSAVPLWQPATCRRPDNPTVELAHRDYGALWLLLECNDLPPRLRGGIQTAVTRLRKRRPGIAHLAKTLDAVGRQEDTLSAPVS